MYLKKNRNKLSGQLNTVSVAAILIPRGVFMSKKIKIPCHAAESMLCPFSNGRLRLYVVIRKSGYDYAEIQGIYLTKEAAETAVKEEKQVLSIYRYEIIPYKLNH